MQEKSKASSIKYKQIAKIQKEANTEQCLKCQQYEFQNIVLKKHVKFIEKLIDRRPACHQHKALEQMEKSQINISDRLSKINMGVSSDLQQNSQLNLLKIYQISAKKDKKVGQVAKKSKPFNFEIIPTKYCENFLIKNRIVQMKSTKQQKFQIVSKNPISITSKDKIGIKVIRSTNGVIYFGLITKDQIYATHSAKSTKGNIISYKITGGKQLLLRQQNFEGKVPKVNEGECLFMVVDYKRGQIEWLIDDQSIVKTKVKLSLQDDEIQDWYPFVTMETAKDKIQLL